MKEREKIIGYSIKWKPITAGEAKAQYENDLVEVKNGKYSTIEAIMEKAKQWLKPI